MRYSVLSFLLVCFMVFSGHAQTTISFGYDNSGNRDLREVISMQKSMLESSSTASEQNETTATGTESVLGNQKVCIYPNPTKGVLRVTIPGLTNGKASIRVYSSSGRFIVNQPSAKRDNVLDLSNYPKGFYILRIEVGTEQKEWKIIKD